MDKTISQLLDIFKHLGRDILSYVLPGIFVIGNLMYIDICINSERLISFFSKIDYIFLIIILVCYGIGQILMGLMYLLVEKTKLEKLIVRIMKVDSETDLQNEIRIYLKNREIYDFFVERYNQLYYLRWNLAGAGLLGIILNSVSLFYSNNDCKFVMLLLFSIALFIMMLILHYVTGHHYNQRVKNIIESLKE